MSLSISEQATLNFYEWEYLGRGYFLFNSAVDIEPPFKPFYFKDYINNSIDDGKVSLKSLVSNIFKTEEKEQEIDELPVIPKSINPERELRAFSISFSKEQEISPVISSEFLNILSYTDDVISFEIIATFENINVQIACEVNDEDRIKSLLKAYFPNIVIQNIDVYALGFITNREIAIADFGYNEEYMRPINTVQSFNTDPLTSVIATMENLRDGEILLFQIIFKGIIAPWAHSITQSVSDGQGGSFFADSPEMIMCAKDKVSSPLFSTIVRIAVQGNSDQRSRILAQDISRSISNISQSQFNKLIPLSNEGYEYEHHVYNIYERRSNRFGMIMNANELVPFVHYPNRTIVSNKLRSDTEKTKRLPKECILQKYTIGVNIHNGTENIVSLSDTQRLKHLHIIGATGVGKSTLIANMMIEDMNKGNGCALFDPHGDIVDDILLRIPEQRKDDVIVIDPSDTNFPIGFNLLQANTDVEKIVLSSDLVSSFKRHATAWGDNMTAVLSNAINTFLESEAGGTLIELKRFLLETNFRKSFLNSVNDQSLHYYWEYEYPMVKKGIAPLLTRIDTFLRAKIIRSMFAQKNGVDFKETINTKKILLIKLSQGLIGEQNSYLLGSIFISKLNQVAQNRQNIHKEDRHPFYIYIDEFHNFITPSISSILSGARKYGIGLTLAHQELSQIEDIKTLNSVISNPYTRICFRLGDNDSKRLETGFSYFEQSDLQSLDVGQAITRVGSSNNDFNLQTYQLEDFDSQSNLIKEYIIQNTRNRYAKPQQEVQELLDALLPKIKKNKREETKKEVIEKKSLNENPNEEEKKDISKKQKDIIDVKTENISDSTSKFEEEKEAYIKRFGEREQRKKHRSLQNFVRTMAIQRGFKTTLEEETKNGGRVDVGLTKDNLRIAIEISVSNTVEYEVKNIQKCIDEGYNIVFMISEDEKHLEKIEKLSKEKVDKEYHGSIFFLSSNELSTYFNALDSPKEKPQKRINGWRVKVNYHPEDIESLSGSIKSKIRKVINNE